jgi:hypothetical protein
MKKLFAIALLFAVAVGLGAQTPAIVPTWTAPDVLTAQNAAGVALIAYKSSLETQINAMVTGINNVNAAELTNAGNISSLQTAVKAIPPSSVPAVDPYSYLSSSTIAPITEAGVCTPSHDFTPKTAGGYADYTLTVPTAGSHVFVACIASGTTSSAPWSFHFEYPVGTNLGALSQASIASPLNNWSVFRLVPSAAVTLPSGPITVRVVFDTITFNFGGFSVQ